MKKLSLLLAACLILTCVICFSSCGSSWNDGVFTYAQTYSKNDKSDATFVVKSVVDKENAVELTIPESYDNLPVTGIDETAFDGCKKLQKITIPASITDIDPEVFDDCPALEEVIINATSLEEAADMFLNAGSSDKTVKVKISAGVTVIPEGMFRNCANLEITFKPGCTVKTIEKEAFKNSSLTFVELSSLESIESEAFAGCAKLTSVSLGSAEGQLYFESLDGGAFTDCANLTSVTIKNTKVTVPGNTFNGCVKLQNMDFAGAMNDWTFNTDYSKSNIGKDLPDVSTTGIFLTVTCTDGTISYKIDGTVVKN